MLLKSDTFVETAQYCSSTIMVPAALPSASALEHAETPKKMSNFTSFAGDGGDTLGKRDWSNLPKPVIRLILMGLRPTWRDVFSFAGVCNPWRSVFTDCKGKLFSSMPPLLVDCSSFPAALDRFYSIFERRFCRRKQLIPRPRSSDWFVVGVSNGYWIISDVKCSNRMTVFLLDPLFPESRIELPPASHSELGRGAIWVDKFSGGFMTAPPTSPDCVIVLTEMDRIVWYCRPGDREWVCHDLTDEFEAARWDAKWLLCHAAVHGRHLYAMTWSRKLVVMELLFPRPKVAVVDVEGLPSSDVNDWDQLVVSDGEILYIEDKITRHFDGHKVTVRRLDLPARRWVTLNTLGKRTIFLPQEVSWQNYWQDWWWGTPVTCVGAAEWGGREDCIYYFECVLSSSALVGWSMKDGIVEHHWLPEKFYSWQWLVPNSCSTIE